MKANQVTCFWNDMAAVLTHAYGLAITSLPFHEHLDGVVAAGALCNSPRVRGRILQKAGS